MQLVHGLSLSLMLVLLAVLSLLVDVDQVAACGGGKGGSKMGGKGMKFGKGFGKEKFGKKMKKVKHVGSPWYSGYEEEPYAVARPRYVDVPVYRPRYVEQDYYVESRPARRQVAAPKPYGGWQHGPSHYPSAQMHHEYPPAAPTSPYELHNMYPPMTHPPTERPSFRKELGRALGKGLMKAMAKDETGHH